MFAVHFVLMPHIAMVAAFRARWGGTRAGNRYVNRCRLFVIRHNLLFSSWGE